MNAVKLHFVKLKTIPNACVKNFNVSPYLHGHGYDQCISVYRTIHNSTRNIAMELYLTLYHLLAIDSQLSDL